ncbi:putative necrosis-inducing factor-domain-containing protein [Whalleya microplaca]|nr:putative necrosis-inducing factor-domain-containing protein [Whalleya microplaca]
MRSLILALVLAFYAAWTTASTPEYGFVEKQVTHSNGSIVSVFLRNDTSTSQPSLSLSSRGSDFWSVYYPWDKSPDRCGDSSIFAATCDLSANVPDCQALIDYHNAHQGMWEFGNWDRMRGESFQTLAKSGDCAFGVSVINSQWTAIDVGGQDIVDLIIQSWNYAYGGKVGTYGQMQCGEGTAIPVIAWALYHPLRFP